MRNDEHDDYEVEFNDPNGPSYTTAESRIGPPLAYVGEKLRATLLELQRVLHAHGATDDHARSLHTALDTGLRAYCALYNTLGVTNAADFHERLSHHTPDQFAAWLDRVEREGSVRG